jgi:hypothetical protein
MTNRKKALYVVSLSGGYLTLIAARSLPNANKQAQNEHGRAHVERVYRASDKHIAHIRAMGGFIPEVK